MGRFSSDASDHPRWKPDLNMSGKPGAPPVFSEEMMTKLAEKSPIPPIENFPDRKTLIPPLLLLRSSPSSLTLLPQLLSLALEGTSMAAACPNPWPTEATRPSIRRTPWPLSKEPSKLEFTP